MTAVTDIHLRLNDVWHPVLVADPAEVAQEPTPIADAALRAVRARTQGAKAFQVGDRVVATTRIPQGLWVAPGTTGEVLRVAYTPTGFTFVLFDAYERNGQSSPAPSKFGTPVALDEIE